ncbi:MAG: ABC transporter permease [Parcubacteria group bacterium]|nr:ABC transporter permease [Parcubacteria group bacterium]
MHIFDYIRTGLKNLWRQKLRSSLTIVAVVIGAISVIVMVSLVIGAKSVFMQQLEAMGALTQVTVTGSSEVEESGSNGPFGFMEASNNEGEGAELNDEVVEKLKGISHVQDVSPAASVWGFQSARLDGSDKKYSAMLVGYKPTPAFEQSIIAGRNLEPGEIAKIVIGGGLLDSFGYEDNPSDILGQKVVFKTNKGYTGYGVDLPKPPAGGDQEQYWEDMNDKTYDIEAEIVGVMSPGPGDQQNFITMAWAKQILTNKFWKGQGGESGYKSEPQYELDIYNQIKEKGYGSIMVKVDSTDNVEQVASDIEEMDLGASTAKDFLDELTKLLNILGVILGAIGAVSLAVATIGIVNTMVMAIYERTREIGVMRACGASRGVVRKLFTLEAALLGLLGGLMGVAVSYGLATVGNYYGNQYLLDQGMSFSNIISLPWWLLLGIIGFTTLVGLLAGLYPAWRASRLDPVEALRRE